MRKDFNPKIWGPHAWFFIENIALGYSKNPTVDEINAAYLFFTN